MNDHNNIYRAARIRAASRRHSLFANRTRAAEILGFSADALDDYENGRTIPPCFRVQRMIEEYGAPELRNQHIRHECPLLDEHMTDNASELSLAACGWGALFAPSGNVQETAVRLLTIARDGRIGDHEVEAAKEVREEALRISRLMQETVTAIDKALESRQGKREC